MIVLFGIYVVGSLALIGYLIRSARDERRALEDRLIALSNPVALAAVKVREDSAPGELAYIDDRRMKELDHGEA